MSNRGIYAQWQQWRHTGRKGFAVLVDPDKEDGHGLEHIMRLALDAAVDVFLVGGSHLHNDNLTDCVAMLKQTGIPVVLFPGNAKQIDPAADGILLLSLISGRNPELLIGQHVGAASTLQTSGLEVMPTGYMLIDGGSPTSVAYVSGTQPIPRQAIDIACDTALAGQLLGLGLVYLEAGSGAKHPVPLEMIRTVRNQLHIPLIVGGGIRTPEAAIAACEAGADLIVVGNAIEKDPSLIADLAEAVHLAGIKAKP
jgi:putative glycerol-1-phosphate prenyltransferase